MSDPVQLAKQAREQLSAALNALQTNAQVPDDLMAIADPIADAMSVLHRVERSGGADLEGRDEALKNVRAALDGLQRITTHHPATDVVMEHVALSLAKVHALAKYQPPAPAPAPRPVEAPRPVAAAAPAAAPAFAARGTQMLPSDANPRPQTTQPFNPPAQQQQPQYVPPPPGFQAQQAPAPYAAPQQVQAPYVAPQQQAPAPYAPPQQAQAPYVAPQQQQAPAPYAAPQQAPYVAPQPRQAQPAPQQPAPAANPYNAYAPPAAPQAAAPAPQRQNAAPAAGPTPTGKVLDVELGTHSPSNFYKGLGGNDVIEHGGIFVATYKVPKIGTTVALRMLLPGDLEFQANAVVQWTREGGGAGENSEPGFGARFTQITAEGRQLVYRYTRNREPIFYDDL